MDAPRPWTDRGTMLRRRWTPTVCFRLEELGIARCHRVMHAGTLSIASLAHTAASPTMRRAVARVSKAARARVAVVCELLRFLAVLPCSKQEPNLLAAVGRYEASRLGGPVRVVVRRATRRGRPGHARAPRPDQRANALGDTAAADTLPQPVVTRRADPFPLLAAVLGVQLATGYARS
jgi:hypothetical protein